MPTEIKTPPSDGESKGGAEQSEVSQRHGQEAPCKKFITALAADNPRLRDRIGTLRP